MQQKIVVVFFLVPFLLPHAVYAISPEESNKSENTLQVQFNLEELQKQTSVPILFTTEIYDSLWEGVSGMVYLTLYEVTSSQYSFNIGFTPSCAGATVCRIGTLQGEHVSSKSPKLKGKKIALIEGKSGYFSEGDCGASCADSLLTWREGPYQYQVGLKAGGLKDLQNVANTLILFAK